MSLWLCLVEWMYLYNQCIQWVSGYVWLSGCIYTINAAIANVPSHLPLPRWYTIFLYIFFKVDLGVGLGHLGIFSFSEPIGCDSMYCRAFWWHTEYMCTGSMYCRAFWWHTEYMCTGSMWRNINPPFPDGDREFFLFGNSDDFFIGYMD